MEHQGQYEETDAMENADMEIEQELQKVTGLKPKKTEERLKYVERLVLAAQDLTDDAWDALSDPTQRWVNGNAKAIKDGKELRDFADGDGQANGQEVVDKPTKKSAKKDDDGDEPAKKDKPAKKTKPAGATPKADGVKNRIKKMLLRKPDMTAEQIYDKLKADGDAPSKMTVSGIRAEFRHSLRLLKDQGFRDSDGKEIDI